jgi:hypothetical protein
MKIITDPISLAELDTMAKELFEDMVKGVVDVDQGQLALNAELHSDLEALLLKNGAKQSHLWGINLYPALFGQSDFLEFDSLINIRPSQGNRSRSVDDEKIRSKISEIVYKKVRTP